MPGSTKRKLIYYFRKSSRRATISEVADQILVLRTPPALGKSKLGNGETILCALLLEGQSFPFDAFLKQATRTRIAGKAISGAMLGDRGVFSFDVVDEFFALSLMPVPFPAADLEGPIATAWLWPEQPPIETIKQHRSHLLITMTGGAADPVRRRLFLTAVTALAAQQPGVMAVYWPEATLVHFPPFFVDTAASFDSQESPPLYLWVDFRAFKNQDGSIGLFTTGLGPLGHMEIEIPSIQEEPGEMREWLLGIAGYVLKNGPVLEHGQTIGMSAEHKLRIAHCESSFGHAGKVLRLKP